ncbi:glycine betaine/L-proline ABC transporter substrate-binding protein ProX [Bosea sp. TAF32]|uniref:glycine betaine/L-proline ABC transporter substrate-binding protein ProX n=1 Tax=Bosea sp. TAF32 TaxID=3237482 RepID=UPI003F8FAAAA
MLDIRKIPQALLVSLGLFACGAAPAAGQAALPGAGKTVSPARPNWDSFWFGQRIIDIGIETLGYKVEAPKTLAPAAVFTSMARGDVTYTADTILPNHADLYAKTANEVVAIGPLMDPGTIQGYMVDKKTADAHNIRFLEDLADPKIAALFDQNGDGKADMVGPSVSWSGSYGVAQGHMKALGLEKTVTLVTGEYTTLAADAVARYAAGKPVFLYTWYPNPTTMKLLPGKDLVWLQLKNPALPPDQMKTYKPLADVAGCAGNPCSVGWLPTVYYIGANKKWVLENPAAAEFFKQIKMTLKDRADQNQKMLNGENREADIDRHAREWIKAHQAEFDGWIKAAIAAAK